MAKKTETTEKKATAKKATVKTPAEKKATAKKTISNPKPQVPQHIGLVVLD